jgi:hypothetical protein
MCHLGRSVYPYINPTEMDDHDETDEVFWSPPLKYPKGSMIVNMMSSQPVSSATQYHDRTWIAVNYHKRVYIHSIRHDVDCQTGRTIDAQYFGPYLLHDVRRHHYQSPSVVDHLLLSITMNISMYSGLMPLLIIFNGHLLLILICHPLVRYVHMVHFH